MGTLTDDWLRDDLIYAAAFFDGEGNVTITTTPSGFAVQLCVYNTYEPVVDWFHQTFGGAKSRGSTPNDERHYRPRYRWGLSSGRDIARFAAAIRPFCRVKGQQLDIMCEFTKLIGTPGVRLTDEQINARLMLMLQMRQLNSAGPGKPNPASVEDVHGQT